MTPIKSSTSIPQNLRGDDDEVDAFDPELGCRRLRFAALSGGQGGTTLKVWRSVMPGLWVFAGAVIVVPGGGEVAFVDVDVTDEEEMFVLVSDGEDPALRCFAQELRPAGEGGERPSRRLRPGDESASELLEDLRRQLPRVPGATTLPEQIRMLADEHDALRGLKRDVAGRLGLSHDCSPQEVADAFLKAVSKPGTAEATRGVVPAPPKRAAPAAGRPALPDLTAPAADPAAQPTPAEAPAEGEGQTV